MNEPVASSAVNSDETGADLQTAGAEWIKPEVTRLDLETAQITGL